MRLRKPRPRRPNSVDRTLSQEIQAMRFLMQYAQEARGSASRDDGESAPGSRTHPEADANVQAAAERLMAIAFRRDIRVSVPRLRIRYSWHCRVTTMSYIAGQESR